MTRYVIRYRADAMGSPPQRWNEASQRYVVNGPAPAHPLRGHYIKDGGHTTADLQEAKVFLDTAPYGRAFHPSIHELVPVTIAPLAGVARRAYDAKLCRTHLVPNCRACR